MLFIQYITNNLKVNYNNKIQYFLQLCYYILFYFIIAILYIIIGAFQQCNFIINTIILSHIIIINNQNV